MSILFHEIQRDGLCIWRGQRWRKVGQHYLIPEGADDAPENRQFVPSHEGVELLPPSEPPATESSENDGKNN